MNPLRLPLAFVALAATALSAAQTQYLGYEFNGTLAPTVGSGPSLVGNGGTVDADSYDFGFGQGLSLASTALESTTTYTIHLAFSISDGAGYNKILDFKDRTVDQGLYVREGLSLFFGGSAWTGAVPNNVRTEFTLVRDGATSEVRGYIKGTRVWSFVDASNYAALTGTNLWLFQDDTVQNNEQSPGSADFLRFYSGALNDAQVQSITTAVPEPATMAVLGLGAAALLRRRRRKG